MIEVIRAGLERSQLLFVAARGDHHDGQELEAQGVRPDPPAHLVPVELRHDDVEQHEIRRLCGEPFQRFRSGARGVDGVAARPENSLEQADVLSQNRPRRRTRGVIGAPRSSRAPRCDSTVDGRSRMSIGFSTYPIETRSEESVSRSSFIANAVTATTGHGGGLREGAQLAKRGDAVHSRELDVHQHELRRLDTHALERLLGRCEPPRRGSRARRERRGAASDFARCPRRSGSSGLP